MPPSVPLLPDDIAKSHTHLTQLLETCAKLPFYDVARTLRYAFEHERSKGYSAMEAFMERLPTYIAQHLDREVQTKLNASDGLLHSLRKSLRLVGSRPESWEFWGISDLPLLLFRRNSLSERVAKYEDASSIQAIEDNQRLTRLDTIIKAVEELKRVGGLAINASELKPQSTISSALLDIDISTCPLTGLPTRGRATLETTHGGYVLYSFRPIGRAFFSLDSFKATVNHFAAFKMALTGWAGLCRQADELDQKAPVFSGAPEDSTEIVPTTFSEKRSHFLQLLYLAGGNEYKERDILIHDDFPLAFAKDAEEFTRILKSLIDEEWLQYDKPNDTLNDWVGGIRTHYNGVLISREGLKRVKESLEPSYEPISTQTSTIESSPSSILTHLHPAIQQVASSRFASAHYSDAVEKACIALEKAVRDRANQPSDLGGTDLMNRAFSQANPMIMLSPDRGEREGYMFLFRGMWQALRNHHAHNDTATDAPRALEWLGFISALFYKLDEAQPTPA
jgi:uncharacterized protein (TIGR02391 family)